MTGILREKVKGSGFKKSYLAEKIGVQPNYFYMCLKGTRNLAEDKQKKLREILK